MVVTNGVNDSVICTIMNNMLFLIMFAILPSEYFLYLSSIKKPDSIRISNEIYTTFTYDTYGRLVSIADPSAGTITYGYDSYGNKSTETDARGKTVSSTFDKFGKVLKRVTPANHIYLYI